MSTKSNDFAKLTRDAFMASASGTFTIAAAIIVRANHEGGLSKDFRAILKSECIQDGIPDGTLKTVLATVGRIFDRAKATIVADAAPSEQARAMCDWLMAQFPTARAFVAYRTDAEVADRAKRDADAKAKDTEGADAPDAARPDDKRIVANPSDIARYLGSVAVTSDEALEVIRAVLRSLAPEHCQRVMAEMRAHLADLETAKSAPAPVTLPDVTGPEAVAAMVARQLTDAPAAMLGAEVKPRRKAKAAA